MSVLHQPPPKLESDNPIPEYRTPGSEAMPHLSEKQWQVLVNWIEKHRRQLHRARTLAFAVRIAAASSDSFPTGGITSHGFSCCNIAGQLVTADTVTQAAKLAAVEFKE